MEDFRKLAITLLYRELNNRGFVVSNQGLTGLVSFDMIARREDEIFIIKILHNIDTFRESNSMELVHFSGAIDAVAVVIGNKASNGPLEDGVVYFRHKVPILTVPTFLDYVDGLKPFVYSGPGGFYVSINGEKLHEKREMHGYSIGYVSGKVGISRRSISLYESGSAATIDVFLKLERLFGTDITSDLDLSDELRKVSAARSQESMIDDFTREIFSALSSIGIGMLNFRRTPFDALLTEEMRSIVLIDLVRDMIVKSSRIESMKNIADVIGNESIIVPRTKTDKERIHGCPVVSVDDLAKIEEPGDLLSLIAKKKSSR